MSDKDRTTLEFMIFMYFSYLTDIFRRQLFQLFLYVLESNITKVHWIAELPPLQLTHCDMNLIYILELNKNVDL